MPIWSPPGIAASQKGAANGVALLDASAKLALSQLPQNQALFDALGIWVSTDPIPDPISPAAWMGGSSGHWLHIVAATSSGQALVAIAANVGFVGVAPVTALQIIAAAAASMVTPTAAALMKNLLAGAGIPVTPTAPSVTKNLLAVAANTLFTPVHPTTGGVQVNLDAVAATAALTAVAPVLGFSVPAAYAAILASPVGALLTKGYPGAAVSMALTAVSPTTETSTGNYWDNPGFEATFQSGDWTADTVLNGSEPGTAVAARTTSGPLVGTASLRLNAVGVEDQGGGGGAGWARCYQEIPKASALGPDNTTFSYKCVAGLFTTDSSYFGVHVLAHDASHAVLAKKLWKLGGGLGNAATDENCPTPQAGSTHDGTTYTQAVAVGNTRDVTFPLKAKLNEAPFASVQGSTDHYRIYLFLGQSLWGSGTEVLVDSFNVS